MLVLCGVLWSRGGCRLLSRVGDWYSPMSGAVLVLLFFLPDVVLLGLRVAVLCVFFLSHWQRLAGRGMLKLWR